MRLIDADAYENEMSNAYGDDWDKLHILESMPTVEQKHGHWERVNKKLKTAGEPEAYCSNCGRPVSYYIENNIYHFDKWCAGCGAKMEERCEE